MIICFSLFAEFALAEEIKQEIYVPKIEIGDGITHLARKTIIEFIKREGIDPRITVPHLVYIEDRLAIEKGKKTIYLKDFSPINFSSEEISRAINKALLLNEKQILSLEHYALSVSAYFDLIVNNKLRFNIKKISDYNLPQITGLGYRFIVYKDNIFLLDIEKKIMILDIANSKTPKLIAEFSPPPGARCNNLASLQDNLIALFCWNSFSERIIYFLEVDNPFDLKIISEYKFGKGNLMGNAAIKDSLLFLSDYNLFEAIDVGDIKTPKLIFKHEFDDSFEPVNITKKDNLLIVGYDKNSPQILWLFDAKNFEIKELEIQNEKAIKHRYFWRSREGKNWLLGSPSIYYYFPSLLFINSKDISLGKNSGILNVKPFEFQCPLLENPIFDYDSKDDVVYLYVRSRYLRDPTNNITECCDENLYILDFNAIGEEPLKEIINIGKSPVLFKNMNLQKSRLFTVTDSLTTSWQKLEIYQLIKTIHP